MEFIDIINQQRAIYLKQLTDFYLTRTNGVKEILLELNREQEEERVFKLYRLDYLEKVNGEDKLTELSPDTYINYSPVNFILGQLSIELNPFYWHGCDFVFDIEFDDINWLIIWTSKWIDEEDINPTDNNGFSGVIHSVTRPRNEINGFMFSVDFGTASENSFIELLQAIDRQGIKNVRIGSFEMIE